MTLRKSGKNLALWMAADDATAPVAGDLVAHVTGISFSGRANISNVTAAGDTGAQKVGGIPDSTFRITGRPDLTSGGTDLMLAAFNDQLPRNFTMLWDDDDVTDGLDFAALVSEYGQSGQYSSPWDFSASLEVVGLVAEDRT